MRSVLLVFILSALAVAVGACGEKKSDGFEYSLHGQVLSLKADHTEANIKHDEIKGFMPAMTMPYKVKNPKEFEGLVAGDVINGTLVVESNDAYLKNVKKVGQAPLEAPPPDTPMPTASSGFELLKEGASVPDAKFVDQDGKTFTLHSLKGSAVVITFIYTKCPMPTFCPLMDRNFAALQEKVKADPALNVRLLTVSFDPANDTPPVLKAHAKKLGANPKIWTFLTGDRDDIDKFAAQFGVSLGRPLTDQGEITHNLRTVILDRMSNMVRVYTGNEWTPSQVMADIKALVGVD